MAQHDATPIHEAFVEEMNDLLVTTFRSIERYEELALHNHAGFDLSLNEAHLIEAVGRGCQEHPDGITVTQIAEALDVRVPTATASVNRLVAKGFLQKTRNPHDLRSVDVSLTRPGEKAYRLHAMFHQRMARAVAEGFSKEELDVLTRGIRNIKEFFVGAAELESGNGAPAPQGKRPAGDASHDEQEV